MKRIDSFFKKCDTPMQKQCDDKEVKKDKAQPSNSEPKNHSCASESSSDPVTAVKAFRHFHPEWKSNVSLGIYQEEKKSCEVHRTYQAHIEPRLGYQVVPVG